MIPPDRSNAKTIHLITAAEALYRYDEEHLRPSTEWEPTLPYGESACWIPDSMDVRVAVMGTEVEMTVKARDLRAVDRHLECKRALESLRVDQTVLAGKLDLAPDAAVDAVDGDRADFVGMEPGSTGFCRVVPVMAGPVACAPATRGSGTDSRAGNAGSGGLDLGAGGEEGLAPADGGYPAKRKKRRKTSVVAEDGVSYELPTYVQNVETKLSRSTLRLKMPLNGFLVNGDHIAVADVVIANGLDVTRKNLLALRLDGAACGCDCDSPFFFCRALFCWWGEVVFVLGGSSAGYSGGPIFTPPPPPPFVPPFGSGRALSPIGSFSCLTLLSMLLFAVSSSKKSIS